MAKIAFETDDVKVSVVDNSLLEIRVGNRSVTLDRETTIQLIRFVGTNLSLPQPTRPPPGSVFPTVQSGPSAMTQGFNAKDFAPEGQGLTPEELKKRFPGLNTTKTIGT